MKKITKAQSEFMNAVNEPQFEIKAGFCVVVSLVESLGLMDAVMFIEGNDEEVVHYLMQAFYKDARARRILKKLSKQIK